MSGKSAANTLLQIKIATEKAKGKEVTPDEEKSLLAEISEKYNEQLSPYYAAARMWIDEIIEPEKTRVAISMGIQAANHAPITEKFNVGVIQT